jgi:putative hydrolase of the HAD superfamily
MIKAIIFDCFGVLVTEGWLAFKDQYFGSNEKLANEATDLLKQADSGLLSHEDFVQAIAKLAQVPAEDVHLSIDNNVPNEPLFAYIAELKPKYKIGMLSNAAANWLNVLFTPPQLALFDDISLSYESGFVKPHHGAYEKIADQIGVKVGDCIFVDDQIRHCEGARLAGMRAIMYQDFPQLKRDLNTILADSKS